MRISSSLRVVPLSLACATSIAGSAQANVGVEPPFASHMVLQRDQVNPIWGTASSGESVSVTVGDQTQSTTTASTPWMRPG